MLQVVQIAIGQFLRKIFVFFLQKELLNIIHAFAKLKSVGFEIFSKSQQNIQCL